MNSSVPTEWITDELARFCDIVGGGTPDRAVHEYWGGQIPWVSPTEVTSLVSKYISKTKEGLTQLGLDKSSAKLHPPGTLLMTSRASIGYVAINTVPMATNQGFQSLRCKDGTLTDYMYQYITWVRPELERLSAGSTFSEISSVNVKRLRVTLPPLPEQQKIATILSSVDDVIEKTRAQIDKLKDLKTGMMQELLTKGIGHTEFKDSPVGRIPQEWEVKPLTEAIEVKHGFQFRENHFHDTGMPVVKIKNLTYNSFVDMEGCSFVPKTVFPNYASFLVEKGDILMALTGATLGKVSVYDSTSPSLQNYRVGNFYPKHNVMIKHYVFWILQSEFVQQRVEELVNEAAQPNIGKADLEGMLIPVPSCFEQVKITDTLDAIFDRYMLLEKKLNQLKCQKKALMQDLLTGKVRVNLTDKESAVV